MDQFLEKHNSPKPKKRKKNQKIRMVLYLWKILNL